MAFSINSHAGEEVQGWRTEEGEEEMQKEKEKKKKKSKAEALPNHNRGSFPTSFLSLALHPAQQSVSFS